MPKKIVSGSLNPSYANATTISLRSVRKSVKAGNSSAYLEQARGIRVSWQVRQHETREDEFVTLESWTQLMQSCEHGRDEPPELRPGRNTHSIASHISRPEEDCRFGFTLGRISPIGVRCFDLIRLIAMGLFGLVFSRRSLIVIAHQLLHLCAPCC